MKVEFLELILLEIVKMQEVNFCLRDNNLRTIFNFFYWNFVEEGLAAEPGIKLCSDAKKFKIPITIHAGESGDANEVVRALDVLYADRIGHGYRIIHDDKVYNRIRNDKVHLECCPWSSLLTAAISPGMLPHPVVE